MAEIHWTNYIGMATGVLGFGLACYSNYRVSKLSRLDKHVDIGLSQNALREQFQKLQSLHSDALRRRQRVASATQQLQSGAMQQWEQEWHEDQGIIEEMKPEVERCLEPTAELDHKDLAEVTIQVDATRLKIEKLVRKYEEWEEWNKQKQSEIREAHMANFRAGRTSSPPE